MVNFKQGDVIKSNMRSDGYELFLLVLHDMNYSEFQFNGVILKDFGYKPTFIEPDDFDPQKGDDNDDRDYDREIGYTANNWNTPRFEISSYEEFTKRLELIDNIYHIPPIDYYNVVENLHPNKFYYNDLTEVTVGDIIFCTDETEEGEYKCSRSIDIVAINDEDNMCFETKIYTDCSDNYTMLEEIDRVELKFGCYGFGEPYTNILERSVKIGHIDTDYHMIENLDYITKNYPY